MVVVPTLSNAIQSSFHTLRLQWLAYLANIGGLALAFAFFVLAMGYVSYQSHFDQWIPNYQNKFRTTISFSNPETKEPIMLGRSFGLIGLGMDKFPEITNFAYIQRVEGRQLTLHHDKSDYQISPIRAEASALEFFGLEIVNGHTEIIDGHTESVLISQSKAAEIFPDTSPLEQLVELSKGGEKSYKVKVVGVFEDMRSDSHIQFNLLQLMPPDAYGNSGFFSVADSTSYLELAEGTELSRLAFALSEAQNWNVSGVASHHQDVAILPIDAIHRNELGTTYLYLMVAISVLCLVLLLVALFNFSGFMLINTSRRLREIALRKTFGLTNRSILQPFLLEILLCLLSAFALGMLVALVIYQRAQVFLGAHFNLMEGYSSGVNVWLLGVLVLVLLASMALPMFGTLKTKPSQLFSGSSRVGNTAGWLLPGYVAVQMAMAVIILSTTVGIYSQFQLQSTKKTGFTGENVLVLRSLYDKSRLGGKLQRELISRLQQISGVTTVSSSSKVPLLDNARIPLLGEFVQGHRVNGIDASFLEVYQIKLLAGAPLGETDFKQARAIHSQPFEFSFNSGSTPSSRLKHFLGEPNQFNLLISKSALSELGFTTPEKAIGHTFNGSFFDEVNHHVYRVVGVIPDLFHDWQVGGKPVAEFYQAIPNVAAQLPFQDTFSISWQGENKENFVQTVKELSLEYFKHAHRMEVMWFSEALEKKLLPERNRLNLYIALAIVMIVIAALGLHFAVSAQAQRMRREMAVRKVFGSSNLSVLLRVYLTYAKPVLIANLLAWPIAYLALQRWLAQYNDRIEISPWMFLSATGLSLLVMVLVVTKEAIRQAYSKPIEDLQADDE